MFRRLIAVTAFVAALWVSHAYPHDLTRPELDDWFANLRNQDQGYCCAGVEAEEVEWRAVTDGTDAFYEIRSGGYWRVVPNSAVVRGPNLAGHALVWFYTNTQTEYTEVRCFMPGSEG